MMAAMDRRAFLRATVVGAGAVALDPLFFPRLASAACSATSPYGPMGAADANNIRLPAGFTSRVVAVSGQVVAPSTYVWHSAPDGGATFSLSDGGWAYVSNCERSAPNGGAASISFASDGTITDARRILTGTSINCAGGPTPWGTWLSCEEVDRGFVYECDPLTMNAVQRPALGRFRHEAAAVDPERQLVYLTEDESDGRLYRVRYSTPANLTSAGALQVAVVDGTGRVSWQPIPDPAATTTKTRYQVPEATIFKGGEGAWYGHNALHFTTKGDSRVWRLDGTTKTLAVVYDNDTSCNPVLTGVDNVTVHRSGDVFVAEDGGNLQLVILSTTGGVAPFLKVMRQKTSELAGPAFSPDGNRLYFSSQRGAPSGIGSGITYEISGPFRS